MGPCHGLRVVEIGSMVTAPMAAKMLADMGAEVIKIEPPGGEIMRSMPPVFKGVSASFVQWNRNKKMVEFDLKDPAGLEAVKAVIASADVLITNLMAHSRQNFGLTYEALSERNPKLVMAAIYGFGPDGPYSDQPAYDMMMQGITGFMPVQGADGPPLPIRSVVADKITAYTAVIGVLAAITRRHSTGEGELMEISMLDAYASFILTEASYNWTLMEDPSTENWYKSAFALLDLADGHAIGYITTDHHFRACCEAFERQDLLPDPRFSTVPERNRNQGALMSAFSEHTRAITRDQFAKLAGRYKLPLSVVNDIDQFLKDPQVVHNKTMVEFDDPRVGRVRLLNSPIRFHAGEADVRSLASEPGTHTQEILQSIGR